MQNNNIFQRKRLQCLGLWALLLVSQFACSSQEIKVAQGYDPRIPYRVAVLPFVDVSSGDAVPSKLWTSGLDIAPYLSDDRLTKEHAATIVRHRVYANLQRSHFELMNLDIVDSMTQRRGLSTNVMYKAEQANAAKTIGAALGVDAVLFGKVLEWDRSYYGVESVVSVEVELSLRETTTGAILSEGRIRESQQSGVSKLPVATSPEGVAQSVGVATLAGLSNKKFLDLTNTVAMQFVNRLVPSASAQAKSEPPVVYYVAHDIRHPEVFQKVASVVANGTPGLEAKVYYGHGHSKTMIETAPGTYFVQIAGDELPDDKFDVTVRLINKTLRATRMTVAVPITRKSRVPS